MAGYVPLFASLTTGTLCGRWPDIGLWPVVLSLADRHGEVDVTLAYLARITGLPEPEVAACMERFCAPDPGSRSRTHDGRRLVPLDPERGWGWRVVNHSAYRERARKAALDARRTDSGENAQRMRERRDPTRPAMTRDDPPSNRNGNGNGNADSEVLSLSPQPEAFSQSVTSSRAGATVERDTRAKGEPIPEQLSPEAARIVLAANPEADVPTVWAAFRAHARRSANWRKALASFALKHRVSSEERATAKAADRRRSGPIAAQLGLPSKVVP